MNRVFQHARANAIAYLALCASTWLVGLALSSTAQAGNLSVWVCGTWTPGAGVMQPVRGSGYEVKVGPPCPTGGLSISLRGRASSGSRAGWRTTAPTGLTLVGAWVPPFEMNQVGINNGSGHGGGFYWKGGSSKIGKWADWNGHFKSPFFGWQIICRRRSCTKKNHASLNVYEIQLKAQEKRAPSLAVMRGPDLWSQRGWVRGDWPIEFRATDPSGVCRTQALAGGVTLNGSTAAPDRRSWHQCPDQVFTQSVNTSDYASHGHSAFTLTLRAMNAASVWTPDQSWTKRIFVDNVSPTVRLSGARYALSTTGPQHITATATAGPSGVAGILCSVDSAPPSGTPARRPGSPSTESAHIVLRA